jgi:hypothetical protein
MLTPFIGAGVKHKLQKDVELLFDVSYYKAIETNGGYPLAKEAVVPMLGIRMEF